MRNILLPQLLPVIVLLIQGCTVNAGDEFPPLYGPADGSAVNCPDRSGKKPVCMGERVFLKNTAAVVTGMDSQGNISWETDGGLKRRSTLAELAIGDSCILMPDQLTQFCTGDFVVVTGGGATSGKVVGITPFAPHLVSFQDENSGMIYSAALSNLASDFGHNEKPGCLQNICVGDSVASKSNGNQMNTVVAVNHDKCIIAHKSAQSGIIRTSKLMDLTVAKDGGSGTGRCNSFVPEYKLLPHPGKNPYANFRPADQTIPSPSRL